MFVFNRQPGAQMKQLKYRNSAPRFFACLLGFRPNMAVKGTRRTQALLKVSGLFGFAGIVNLCQPARPLLLR
jgi:hypothetical protein